MEAFPTLWDDGADDEEEGDERRCADVEPSWDDVSVLEDEG